MFWGDMLKVNGRKLESCIRVRDKTGRMELEEYKFKKPVEQYLGIFVIFIQKSRLQSICMALMVLDKEIVLQERQYGGLK